MSYFLLPKVHDIVFPHNLKISFDQELKVFINPSLSKYLKQLKGQIELHQLDWEKFKKITNPCEYIHTNIPQSCFSVSLIKPISRSFFKLVEIYNLMNIHFEKSIQTFHLAEGPGGFIEAIKYLRKNSNDVYHGMTLMSNHTSVPGWKKAENLIADKNIHIIVGKDKKGDLYNYENLLYCREHYKYSMDLITGDGGFDFSIDYNKQEEIALRLIFSQVAFAITMQKKNGTFVLKVFDIFLESTIHILYLLSSLYEKVLIIKPKTSRLANSERYIICKKFELDDDDKLDLLIKKFSSILQIFNKINFYNFKIKSILNFDIPSTFLTKLSEINSIIAYEQIDNILYTLKLIKSPEKLNVDTINRNVCRSVKWCQKYGIPFHSKKDYEYSAKYIY